MSDFDFDPFIDWSGLTQEMADDLHEKVMAFKAASDAFQKSADALEGSVFLKTQFELTQIAHAIQQTLFTVPVMVHLAGGKESGEDSAGHNCIEQRCVRCGSVLQRWCDGYAILTPSGPQPVVEDDIDWWDSGDIVAKATGDNTAHMYEIPRGRSLEKHEKECVDLRGLEAPD